MGEISGDRTEQLMEMAPAEVVSAYRSGKISRRDLSKLFAALGLTAADLSGKTVVKNPGGRGTKVAVKYRNAATGDTWSGRGLQPKWLKAALAAGRKIEDFNV